MRNLFIIFLTTLSTIAFALNPVREYEVLPEDYGLEYEELSIPTEDGVKLFAWKFKPMDKSSKTVVVASDGDGNMVDDIEIISQFMSLGYNVISFDYRGYGKSDDFRISTKFFIYAQFAKDLDAVISYVKKYDAKQKVSVYGHGIGGGLAISVGCNNLKVSNVIADAPYTDLETMKQKLSDVKGETVMMPLGFDKVFVEPLFALEEKGDNLDKLMLIVGDADPVTTVDDMKKLTKLYKKAEMYVVKGQTNDKNFSSNKNEYFKQIKDFLEG